MFNICVSLNIENPGYPSLVECLGIVFYLRIVSNIDICVANLVKRKSSNKISVMLFNMAVYYMDLVHIPPEVRSRFTKLTLISPWVHDLQDSGWFSFPHLSVEFVIFDRVFIVDLWRAFLVVEHNWEVPWNDLFSCKSCDWFFR